MRLVIDRAVLLANSLSSKFTFAVFWFACLIVNRNSHLNTFAANCFLIKNDLLPTVSAVSQFQTIKRKLRERLKVFKTRKFIIIILIMKL